MRLTLLASDTEMAEKMWKIAEQFMSWVVYRVLRLHVNKESWEKWCQFVKFGIVGISNTLVYYVVYLILLRFPISYLAASIIAYLISILNSYYWNNKYVFPETSQNEVAWWMILIKTFLAYAGTGLILNNLLLVLWIEEVGLSEMAAPLLNLCITIPVNFVLNKLWAFKRK